MLLMLVFTNVIHAQTNDLTQEQIASFKARLEETIEAFQYGLEIIGDKTQEKDVKQHYKENILSFFIHIPILTERVILLSKWRYPQLGMEML